MMTAEWPSGLSSSFTPRRICNGSRQLAAEPPGERLDSDEHPDTTQYCCHHHRLQIQHSTFSLVFCRPFASCIVLGAERIVSVSVAHWHSARWAWNGYQPGLGSIPRPGWI